MFFRRTRSPDGYQYWCKDCSKDAVKKHYIENLEHRKEYDRLRHINKERPPAGFGILKISALKRISSEINCKVCGFSDIRALHIDHINGGGKCRGNKLYRLILKTPIDEIGRNYQILCANHNWIKRYENNEFRKMN